MPTPTRPRGPSTSTTRTWTDVDGDRIVDCDLLNFNAQSGDRRGHLRRADLGLRAG